MGTEKEVADRNSGSVMSLKEKVRETSVCNTTVTKSGGDVHSHCQSRLTGTDTYMDSEG